MVFCMVVEVVVPAASWCFCGSSEYFSVVLVVYVVLLSSSVW